MAFSGKALKFYRKRAGMQARELATKAKCHGNDIYRYEKGLTAPKSDRIAAIAKVLNINPEELTSEEKYLAVSSQSDQTNLTETESNIVSMVLSLVPLRRAKLIGYIEGLLATNSHSAAQLAGEVAQTLSQHAPVFSKRKTKR